MLSDSEKLVAFRKREGKTQAALAAELGVKQQTIAMIENGSRPASAQFKLCFVKRYGVDWDTQLVTAETFTYEHLENQTNQRDNNLITIPFYNISAAAGMGTVLADEPSKECMYFDKRFLNHILRCNDYSSLHLIYAKGDSMDSGWNQPDDIKDGDLLLVDTAQTTGNNQVFVIIVNNAELRVKKLFKRGDALYISSNNPAYKEEVYYPDSSDVEIRVVGKVVWNGKREEM